MIHFPQIGPPLGLPFTLNTTSLQARGLIGWWPAIPSRGTAWRDYTGKYHGVLTGGATQVAVDRFGVAISLDGTDDYATCGAVSTLGLSGDAAFSICVWVNPQSVARNDGMYFSYGTNSNLRVISLGTDASGRAYSVHYSSDHAFTTAGALSTNIWQHLCITYSPSSSTETYYYNGIAKETWSPTDLLLAAGDNLYLGRSVWNGTYAAQCKLADIRLYNRCLGAGEVLAMTLPQAQWELYQPLWPTTARKSIPSIGQPMALRQSLQLSGVQRWGRG